MEKVRDISILELEGDLDRAGSGLFLSRVRELLAQDWNKIVLDFGHVDHCHYRAFAELLPLALFSEKNLGGIKMANVNGYVKQLLQFSGVDADVEVYGSVEEAILSFEKNPDGWLQ